MKPSLFDDRVFTVTEVNEYLESIISQDSMLNNLWVSGEISNFHHHSSGHMYFTLKDKNSCLNSIMFRSNNRNLKFKLEDGMKVTTHGYLGLYSPRGSYQFYVDKIEPSGKGALYLAFEQLKEKLTLEGLFADDNKKEIPLLPRRIGIITSVTGAAIRDILSVVRRRFEGVSVLIVPTLVQGEGAAPQIVEGIEYLNRCGDIDIIIVSRGGGSIEDLWAFNEEIVARAIYNSKMPVISGVGHETDFTIADFVADLRAPTPSAAAELAIASRLELDNRLEGLTNRLLNAEQTRIATFHQQVSFIAEKRIFTRPEELLAVKNQLLDDYSRQLGWTMERKLSSYQERFNLLASKLDAYSPLKTLNRGYSLTTYKNGQVITTINNVKNGDDIITKLKDGTIISKVLERQRDGELKNG